jgi:hypothetical protein
MSGCRHDQGGGIGLFSGFVVEAHSPWPMRVLVWSLGLMCLAVVSGFSAAFQETAAGRARVRGRYRLIDEHAAGFEVDSSTLRRRW